MEISRSAVESGLCRAGEGKSIRMEEDEAFSSSSVTFWLQKWREGDQRALEEVMEQTYEELRRVASRYLRQERREHTLQPTALVHEVYLQLADAPIGAWESRAQFVAATAHI